MSRVARTAVVGLVLAIVLAGCAAGGGGDSVADPQLSGGDGGSGGGDAGRPVEAGPSPTPAPRAEAVDQASFESRQVIQTGRVSLEVDDFDAARRNLSAAVSDLDGFVSDSNRQRHRLGNETYVTGRLVLRVPQSEFSRAMTRVEAEGTVLESSTSSQDVTDQLVDIEARLGNLRAQRDQLRELYRRANDTEDVLAVQSRLSDVQTEIERLEARQTSLQRRVALSTITVELAEPRPEPDRPVPDRWYDVGVVAAFLESVNGVVTAVRAIVVAVAYALPYALAFGGPLAAGYAVLWWRRRAG